MRVNLLKSKMALKGHKCQDLAVLLNLTKSSVSMKMNGKTEFTRPEIEKMIGFYDLTPVETSDIFFT